MKDIISHMVNVANVNVNVLRLVCKEWKTATEQRFADLQSGKIPCGHRKCMRKSLLKTTELFQQLIKKDMVDQVYIYEVSISTEILLKYATIGGNLYTFALLRVRSLEEFDNAITRIIKGGFFKELDHLFEIWGNKIMDRIKFASDLTIEYLYNRKYISDAVKTFKCVSRCNQIYQKLFNIIVKNKYFDRLLDLYVEFIDYVRCTTMHVELFQFSNINAIITRLNIVNTSLIMNYLIKNEKMSKDDSIKYIAECKQKWTLLEGLSVKGTIIDISSFAKDKSWDELSYILSLQDKLSPDQVLKLINERFDHLIKIE